MASEWQFFQAVGRGPLYHPVLALELNTQNQTYVQMQRLVILGATSDCEPGYALLVADSRHYWISLLK